MCRQFTCLTESPGACSPAQLPSPSDVTHRACPLPQYVVLSCVISYLAVTVFLRLPILVKTLVLLAMTAVYIMFIYLSHAPLFLCYDQRIGWVNMPGITVGWVYGNWTAALPLCPC